MYEYVYKCVHLNDQVAPPPDQFSPDQFALGLISLRLGTDQFASKLISLAGTDQFGPDQFVPD